MVPPPPSPLYQPPERRVVFVGDHGIGRSSLIAVSRVNAPFLDFLQPYAYSPSVVQLDTDLAWEMPPCVLGSTSKPSERRDLRDYRRKTLHVINVTADQSHEFRRSSYPNATTVVFCFSIGNESSFENVKDQVK